MGNIFIKETKNFYNYITTTHCKDFKSEYNIYYDRCIALYDIVFNTRKKQSQALYNLYSKLRNNEFVKIKEYIFKEYSEEYRFDEWVKLLKNFGEFVCNFSDPLFIPTESANKFIIVDKKDNKMELTIKHNLFDFNIVFEKSNIKKSNSSSLFDTITGLDKENNLSFIKLQIKNSMSGTKYVYNYMDDSTLSSENQISDDICDLQLEYVKKKLDKFIYDYIGIVFDNIVYNELNMDFNIFNSIYIRNNFKEMEEEWLTNMNMESD